MASYKRLPSSRTGSSRSGSSTSAGSSRTGSSRSGSSRTSSPSTEYPSLWSKESFDRLLGIDNTVSQKPLGGKNTLDNKYINMLGHNAGDDPFAQLLASLGIDEDRFLNQDQRADWNKQLMDAQLQYYQDLEKRQYTQQQLNEQRLYDSPLNQLARLMGAGVSRDAAIAMLSGQAGQPTIAESAVNTPGATASESRNAGVERALGITNAVFNGVSAVSGLVSLGFTIPQAIQQTHYLKNQNLLTGKQLKAYDSTGQAFALLKSIDAGADAFGSVGSAVQAITEAAKNGNQDCLAFLQQGGAQDMFSNVSFASQAMNQMYRSERASSDYKRTYDAEMKKIDADTRLADAQEQIVLKQFELVQQEIAKVGEESRSLRIQNDVDENFYQSYDEVSGLTGEELFNGNRMQQLVQSYQTLARINNPEYWQTYAKGLINNAEFMEMSNAVLTWFENAKLDLLNQNPELFTFMVGMRDCGLNEYAEYVANIRSTQSESRSEGSSVSAGGLTFHTSTEGNKSYNVTSPVYDTAGQEFLKQLDETNKKVYEKRNAKRKRK